ncbi:MAG: TIGR03936 family radical SAM-associated protein [Cutibacterium granulosum]|uniref:TIGR03936 family radical SAM-associated protein n=1 Tax=Cutibacterium granulosum TaxID=33011 RepID=UPI002B224298|nr:TIGR03936 family radical SAM-associated protein [Cutibacterium granulosum]MEA5659160.1 TIGR03936 family radical SAM-associated protein [Cutibacterium granulosum]MEA5660936.1 TIGR03936 family radical SAM-associated protein [Cutibacterium granulosum]
MAHRNQRQPEQLAPPVQRMRLRYAKRSVARFTSHRDFARSFERVLLRARIPMALSSGFNPHPRISYANASPTGAASEAEYLEIALWEVCDPEKVKDALNAEMPTGMEVLEVVESDRVAWTEVLTASAWTVHVPHSTDPAAVSSAVDALLASPTWVVQRMTKSGLRDFDVRGALIGLGADGDLVRMMIRHQTPLVRPNDVMGALESQIDGFDRQECLFTRLYQGRVGLLEDGTADERELKTALIDAFDGRAVQVW